MLHRKIERVEETYWFVELDTVKMLRWIAFSPSPPTAMSAVLVFIHIYIYYTFSK